MKSRRLTSEPPRGVTILAREYRRKVGVDPILTVEPEDFYGGALDL